MKRKRKRQRKEGEMRGQGSAVSGWKQRQTKVTSSCKHLLKIENENKRRTEETLSHEYRSCGKGGSQGGIYTEKE